jgi:S1-C subfamily serine protease
VNALDVIILVVAAGAGVAGWRTGFLTRVAAWVGVAVGLLAAVPLVAPVVTHFGGASPDTRVLAATMFLLLAASLGHGLALTLTQLLGRAVPGRSARTADRAAGALVGVAGAFAIAWMLTPSLAALPGWPARAARSSKVVAAIDDLAPSQPDAFAVWGRSIVRAPYPSALDPLAQPPDPGVPPLTTLSAASDARVRASVLTVRGVACARIQSGTGWVISPGTIVTNAHVVAGERSTTVTDARGNERTATVVAFDPRRDVAVLRVPGLSVSPLAVVEPRTGVTGAVYGHPGGGPLVVSPARVGERITAIGTDIYRTGSSRRDVLVLAARLEPGDSGGPLVDAAGRVIGMAFAVDPGNAATAYALAPDEFRPVVTPAATRTARVPTGGCVVD